MTKIIATIGPASESPKVLHELADAGVDFFRLNFSHGDHKWHARTIDKIRAVNPYIPIILDTKGPEMRTGDIKEKIILEKDSWLTLTTKEEEQNPERKIIFVNHPHLAQDLQKGDRISVDSGIIELSVLEILNSQIITRVIYPGVLGSRRHVNLIEKNTSLPTVTEQDRKDLEFGIDYGIDIIALSFTRDEEGILLTKEICKKMGRPDTKIWAKIENSTGLKNLEKITSCADGIMCARGDLGVETPYEFLPLREIEMIQECQKQGKFSIVATEMLESMINAPRPTRAEITDIAFAVWSGADSVMLSGETASGKYPIACVKVMKKIIKMAKHSGKKMVFL